MTYAVPPPAADPPPSRPVSVTLCAALLGGMGLAGLGYAVATLTVTPGVVQHFRAAAAGADRADVDGFVTVLWVGAGVAAVLGVILFALYVVLALGLRHGSNAARIGGCVVSALGLLAGCVTTVTVLIERGGAATPGTLGTALAGAYPSGWIGLNLAIAIAQMAGYVTVGLLLLLSPGAFFRRPAGSRPRTAGPPAYGPPPADDPSRDGRPTLAERGYTWPRDPRTSRAQRIRWTGSGFAGHPNGYCPPPRIGFRFCCPYCSPMPIW